MLEIVGERKGWKGTTKYNLRVRKNEGKCHKFNQKHEAKNRHKTIPICLLIYCEDKEDKK